MGAATMIFGIIILLDKIGKAGDPNVSIVNQLSLVMLMGGAGDNAKKIVEVEWRQKGADLHAATVVGDAMGDPLKDTSSVARCRASFGKASSAA